ncbi:type 2 isopentenyl-diphosphate Delta-isomerase [Evansella tamaricis]|uniref:Isopentenyl-diphosphate delta-isomerase n=1 Tax=Evansella tamaricis TaxID=2069301 RepID=A0ABS6JKR6_9BACI|nr:type 2 isopentenyl-diphosphate Delta-isomerase [Evansella tamaricis]MBU9714253.1 type 2 isopentenyl-diphosphate Delta-isomerase [Evansella tamaricis]
MSRSKRKLEHIEHALNTGQSRETGFDDIRFIHHSLPDVNVNDISLTSFIGELEIGSPIFINAMTGGGGKGTEGINRQLAEVARELNIPVAVGSQMAAIKNASEISTYQIIRKTNPSGIVFANVGSEATVEQGKACVDMLEANALQIHLNVIQELVMPEGDRHFKGALERIGDICSSLSVPVIVKEVGFGMSRETVKKLKSVGVSIVDVGGYGGTNFSKIENARRDQRLPFFNDWGIPTVVSIAEASQGENDCTVLASGGIQTASDIAKSISLGANAAGMAGIVLKKVQEHGVGGAIDYLTSILYEIKLIMTALGVTDINMLQRAPLVITGHTKEWLEERNISTKYFANRN